MSYLRNAAAAAGHALFAARRHLARAAVPVLLDGADRRSSRTRSCSISTPSIRSGPGRRRSSISTSCCSRPIIRCWLWNTMLVAIVRDTALDHRQRARGLCDRAAALPRRAAGRRRDLSRLSGTAVNPVYSALHGRLPVRPVRHAVCADPHLSDDPDPVLDLAADGLFQDHPLRAGRMRTDRRRQPLADSASRSCCRLRFPA